MKKLYRSKIDRKIAGVCGGLGEYFQMDSIVFRLLFVLTIVLGGLGLLVYSVMWLLVPDNPRAVSEMLPVPTAKRFYLSTSDRKIAGVCGGLGEFFQIDPVIFRVIFVVLLFLGGIGGLLYLLLWFIAPKRSIAAR